MSLFTNTNLELYKKYYKQNKQNKQVYKKYN